MSQSDIDMAKPVQPKISIDNYDPYGFEVLDSPFTLKAIELLGIKPFDLKLKRREDLRAFIREADPGLQEKATEVILRKGAEQYQRLSARIKAARKKLKDKAAQAHDILQSDKKHQETIQKHKIAESERKRREEEAKLRQIIPSRPSSKFRMNDSSYTSAAKRERSAQLGHKLTSMSMDHGANLNFQKLYSEGVRDEAVRQIEGMVDHELHLLKVKESRMNLFEVRLQERKDDLENKKKKFHHVMSEKERVALVGLFKKRLDRDIREFEIEVHRRAHEYQLRMKAEKISEETNKLYQIQIDRDEFKRKKEAIKNQLVRDIGRMKDGMINPSDMKAKYGYLQYDGNLDTLIEDSYHIMDHRNFSKLVY